MAEVGQSTALADPIVTANPVGGAREAVTVGNQAIALLDNSPGSTPFDAFVGPGATTAQEANLGNSATTDPYPEWFERVHIIPSSKIEYGNILSQVDRTFEIYNAYATREITLTTITNNVQPGVELPNITAPRSIPPGASILRPTSTFEPPVPVQDVVRALRDGLASFDSTIDFTFDDSSTLSLSVSGNRIAIVLERPESKFRERFIGNVDILTALSGKEQRIEVRKRPIQQFTLTYRLQGRERQRFQYRLFDWQTNSFGLPLWHEQKLMVAPAVSGATQVQIATDVGSDFRVGGQVLIFKNETAFDISNLSGNTGTILTLDSPLTRDFDSGDLVLPVRIADITATQSTRSKVELEDIRVTYDVVDNDTGADDPDLSYFSTYNSRPFLDDTICNLLFGRTEMQQGFTKRLLTIQNPAGAPFRTSPQAVNKRTSSWGFKARTPAQVITLRNALLGLRSRQVSFWVRTFFADLTAVSSITSGALAVDVENVEYTRFAQSRERFRTLRMELTNGTEIIRTVLSSTEVSSDVERLTVDSAWGVDADVSEIRNLEFLELARFDSDTLEFERDGNHKADITMPVVTVFDTP